MQSQIQGLIALLLSLGYAAAVAEPAYDHHVKLRPENPAIGNFPAQKVPILTIKSGETVKIDTGGGAGWRNPEMDPAEWLGRNNIPARATDAPIKGALFFTGDAHAVQGDGEITGTAIETANTVILKFLLHKGKTLKAPRAEGVHGIPKKLFVNRRDEYWYEP